MSCLSKKIYFSCISLILLNLFGCVSWEKDVVINEIHFEKFVYSSYRGDMIGYLAEDTLIKNYPCKKGFITFYENWSLYNFCLHQSIEFNDFLIPAETWVTLDKEANIKRCQFPRDVEIQGYLCRGGKGGRSGVQTSFHKNRKLKSFFSRKNIEIEGILCKGSIMHPIGLHNNGKLRKCTLAKTIIINGTEHKEKSRIKLDKNTHFMRALRNCF